MKAPRLGILRRLLTSTLMAFAVATPAGAATPSADEISLYQHVTAEELESASVRSMLNENHSLITVRGAREKTDDVRKLINEKGTARIFLYWMGTAISEEAGLELQKSNPGWVAKDSSGDVVLSKPGNYVLDITKPEVRAWLAKEIKASVSDLGYDGTYLDVLGSFFSQRFYSARPELENGPLTDAAWRDASVALINEVKQATGKPVIANGFGIQSGRNYEDHREDSDRLIKAADGIQIEQFTRTGDMPLNKSKNPKAWRSDMELLAKISGQGKLALVNTRVKESSDMRELIKVRDFALASFLVGAEGPAVFQFGGKGAGNQAAEMRKIISDLGNPAGPSQENAGVMTRSFTNGTVTVNPTKDAVEVTINGRPVQLLAGAGRFDLAGTLTPTPGTQTTTTQPEKRDDGGGGSEGGGGGSGRSWLPVLGFILVAIGMASLFGRRLRRGGQPAAQEPEE